MHSESIRTAAFVVEYAGRRPRREERGGRRDVDDVTALRALDHLSAEQQRAVDHAPEVDVQDAPPVVELGVHERPGHARSRRCSPRRRGRRGRGARSWRIAPSRPGRPRRPRTGVRPDRSARRARRCARRRPGRCRRRSPRRRARRTPARSPADPAAGAGDDDEVAGERLLPRHDARPVQSARAPARPRHGRRTRRSRARPRPAANGGPSASPGSAAATACGDEPREVGVQRGGTTGRGLGR